MQVQDLINAAMRSAGILAAGESPTSTESTDALFALNQLVDSWSVERLLIPTVTRQTFALTANNTGTYQIGPGAADFPSALRPVRIERAGLILTQGSTPVEIPLRLLNDDEWASVEVKSLQTSIPTALYSDGGYPFLTLYTWPALNTGGTLALYTWQPLAQFVNLADTVKLPPGYTEAIQYNLAGRLALEYGQQLNPVMVQLAVELKDRIKSSNPAEYVMRADGLNGRAASFNIYNGETV